MPTYPPAERLPLVESLPEHGPVAEVADPYRWLEDGADPRTLAWSAAQDELFAAERAGWTGRDATLARLRELTGSGFHGVPVYRGEREFFSLREPQDEHGRVMVRDGDGPAQVLIDPMVIDPTGHTTLDAYQPNKEGTLVAVQLSSGGDEHSILQVLDVATGQVVDGPIDRLRYSPVAWLRGEDAFYYVRRLAPELVPADEAQYHRRVYLHRLGTSPDEDVEIFGAGRPITSYYGVGVSWDGRWLTVSAAQGTDPRNDVWLADLAGADPAAPRLVPVVVGEDARTGISVGRDGRLYVATDLDAPRGRLTVTDPSTPGVEHWQDLLPEREDANLADYLLVDRPGTEDGTALLVSWTRHAVTQVTVHRPDGTRTGEVTLPGVGTTGGLIGRPEGGTDAWFSYSDYTHPSTVYRLDGNGALHVHALPPGRTDVPAVHTRQVEFTSSDGATVRMFVMAPPGLLDDDGLPTTPAPAVLYGYGGFGNTMTPGYSATIAHWVESGGVYAVAGLRGGTEEGEQWHRAGMLGAKQQVFDDFHAAARTLIDGGWTTPDRLAISGGSNGGLLVGAALTQWPELFAAVVCSAPLLDMVRYQLHGLGVSWTGEYGDATRPEDLAWLLAYSPYHRVVEATGYPAVLFTVFDSDTRVDPLHARKMAAALQHATTSPVTERPVLLRREADVGHGARALSKSLELSADTFTFLATHTGLRVPGGGGERPHAGSVGENTPGGRTLDE